MRVALQLLLLLLGRLRGVDRSVNHAHNPHICVVDWLLNWVTNHILSIVVDRCS